MNTNYHKYIRIFQSSYTRSSCTHAHAPHSLQLGLVSMQLVLEPVQKGELLGSLEHLVERTGARRRWRRLGRRTQRVSRRAQGEHRHVDVDEQLAYLLGHHRQVLVLVLLNDGRY